MCVSQYVKLCANMVLTWTIRRGIAYLTKNSREITYDYSLFSLTGMLCGVEIVHVDERQIKNAN